MEPLIRSLDHEELHWEMILVGNYIGGDDDSTPEVVRRIAGKHPAVHAVCRIKEGMMGWDMKSGLQAATGRTLVVIDGDGQMPFEDVLRVYKMLRDKRLDLVKTYRKRRDDGPYRKSISWVYNLIFRTIFPGLKSRDINSKPKIMTRPVYENMNLKSNGWFIDAEIMIQARRLQLKIGEVETGFYCNDSRPSFVKPTAILEFLANLVWARFHEFRFCFKQKPSRFTQPNSIGLNDL